MLKKKLSSLFDCENKNSHFVRKRKRKIDKLKIQLFSYQVKNR